MLPLSPTQRLWIIDIPPSVDLDWRDAGDRQSTRENKVRKNSIAEIMLNGQSVIFRSKIICIQFSNNWRVVTILNSLVGIFLSLRESRYLWQVLGIIRSIFNNNIKKMTTPSLIWFEKEGYMCLMRPIRNLRINFQCTHIYGINMYNSEWHSFKYKIKIDLRENCGIMNFY